MKELKIRQEALDFLRNKKVAVVCTASETGEPHAATIFFTVDDKFHVFFVTTSDTQKIRHIQKNRHIALVAGAEDSPFSVQINGAAEILEGKEALRVIDELTDLAAKTPFYWPPILRVSSDRLVAVKITPTWVRWLDLRRGSVEKNNTGPAPAVQIIPEEV